MIARNVAAIGFAAVLAMSIVGCSSDSNENDDNGKSEGTEQSVEQVKPAKDFDGSGFEDTGEGTMWLSTPAGTTEDGNVPEIVANPDMVMQIGFNMADMDGSVCTVYVDGMENMKTNAAVGMAQSSITLTGDALTAGIHTVELVCLDGDTPTIYKAAQYKVAE